MATGLGSDGPSSVRRDVPPSDRKAGPLSCLLIHQPEALVASGCAAGRLDGQCLAVRAQCPSLGDVEREISATGLDALGAFDYLQTRGFSPDRIGMHGSSLGGAITLTAFAQEPRLKAIFLDSPLTDPRGAFTQYTGLPDVLFPGVEWAARWVAGDELLRYDPLDGIRRAAGRGLSVVHGSGDRIVEPSHTELLLHVASENGVSVEAWKPPGVGHVEALAGHPRQYQRRMRAFFARHLGRTVHL